MYTTTILIVDKTGVIKETNVKNLVESDLYKKAGFKTNEDFKCHTEWTIDDLDGKSYIISVYGKTTGRANQENKYEFPPPIDSTLFFGNCVLVNKENDKPCNLTLVEWNTIYDYLFGGFDDLDDEEDEEDDDDDEDDDIPRTKSGYAKDGFIVDDEEIEDDEIDEEDDEEEDDDDDDEDEVTPNKKKTKTKSKSNVKILKKSKSKKAVEKSIEKPAPASVPDNEVLECTSELSEEEYV